MKKFIKKSVLLFCLICIACSVSKNRVGKLANTKWIYDFGHDGVVNYILFEGTKNYSYYNAETGDITIGTYRYKNDTIHFYQECSIFDDDFPEGSHHREGKMEYKMLIRNKNQLGFMELWDDDNNKWNEDYFFTKQ